MLQAGGILANKNAEHKALKHTCNVHLVSERASHYQFWNYRSLLILTTPEAKSVCFSVRKDAVLWGLAVQLKDNFIFEMITQPAIL